MGRPGPTGALASVVAMEAARAMPASRRALRRHERRRSGRTAASRSRRRRSTEQERPVEPVELPPGPRLSGSTLATLAAIAGMAAIALGGWAFVVERRERTTRRIPPRAPCRSTARRRRSRCSRSRARCASRSRARTGGAVLAVGSNGRGMLVLDGLGIAPVGRTYQAWVVDDEGAAGGGALGRRCSRASRRSSRSRARIEPGSVVGITVEQAGGARRADAGAQVRRAATSLATR